MYGEYTSVNGNIAYEFQNAPRQLFFEIQDELENTFGAIMSKVLKGTTDLHVSFTIESNEYKLSWISAVIDSIFIISITDEGDYVLQQEIVPYLSDILS